MTADSSSSLFSKTALSLGNTTVHVGFTSRATGNLGLHVGSDPVRTLQHRANLERELGLATGAFCYLQQVHGTEVFDPDSYSVRSVDHRRTVESAQKIQREAPIADAAVSSQGHPLAVMVADCIPLIFVGVTANGTPIIGVAHAGRRGLLDGVIEQTVGDMIYRGASEIDAWIGPSICGRCYEVPEPMREESVALIPEIYAETSWGTPALDLPAAAEAILNQLGKVRGVYRDLSDCTLENENLFSHRRGLPEGRIAGLVWVEKP